jgi:hypothetical protein
VTVLFVIQVRRRQTYVGAECRVTGRSERLAEHQSVAEMVIATVLAIADATGV